MSLYQHHFDTPLGAMVAIADAHFLYVLEFIDRKHVSVQIDSCFEELGIVAKEGTCDPIISIKRELLSYFAGSINAFETPFKTIGTPFQKDVWQGLLTIPYGQTIGYAAQAHALGRPRAQRAVANANARNRLAIIIPCHRVVRSDGSLGGYGAGVQRKKWLIAHEDSLRSMICRMS